MVVGEGRVVGGGGVLVRKEEDRRARMYSSAAGSHLREGYGGCEECVGWEIVLIFLAVGFGGIYGLFFLFCWRSFGM